jgi:signal transduction histidine kinase
MKLIETAKLLEERLRDLRLLFELEHAMGQATSREELAIAVLGETIRACEAKVASIAMTDEESGSTMAYVAGDHISGLRRIPVVLGEGPIGIPMTSGELMCFGEGASDSLSQSECLQLLGDSCESGFVLPFQGKNGETLGALGVFNKRGHRPFRTSDRDIISLIAVNVSTVMQLQKAREVREREERLTAIGRLMSAVIHDLRTPLTIVGGYVQMMVNAQDIGKRKTYAATVGKQFEQIASMQREVLEFARGERTSLVRKVYVAKFFQEVAEQLEHEFGNYGISLHLLLEYKGTARFDEAKIRRVIHNLARNAAEAMGQGGGRFTIRVGRDNETEELLVEFSDTGPGIPKDVREKLFTSFVTSGKKGGTGLGLAIVKKIVDEHGGRISVRSSRSGATFSLRIPMERDGDR